jgi:hypothetical protein
VSFKKTKIPPVSPTISENNSNFASFKNRYFKVKKRNFISAILLGFLGISGVIVVSFATFS